MWYMQTKAANKKKKDGVRECEGMNEYAGCVVCGVRLLAKRGGVLAVCFLQSCKTKNS